MFNQNTISIFDCSEQIGKEKKIWQQFQNSVYENDCIEFKLNCTRISRDQKNLKPINLEIGKSVLYYIKNGIPQGMLPLTFAKLQTQSYNGQLIISLSRNQKKVDLKPENSTLFLQQLTGKCIQTSFHEDFIVEKKIGCGNQATVFQATKKSTGVKYAVKAFNKNQIQGSKDEKTRLENEISVMRQLKQDNILSLHEVYETQNSVYLILELVNGGDLHTRMKKQTITEQNIKQVMEKILNAINYMHKQRFIHRDLKPQNILLRSQDSYELVLANFGLAVSLDDSQLLRRCGTPGFIAPEILNKDTVIYTEKCDIFSLGSIFYMLVTGNCPFKGTDIIQTIELNKQCEINFYVKQLSKVKFKFYQAPKQLQSLMKKMLRVNPKTRYNAEQCLNHNYFKDDGQKNQIQEAKVQVINSKDEIANDQSLLDPKEIITQEQQWNGFTYTLGSISNLSNTEIQKPKDKFSKFSKFCLAMETFKQNELSQKKQDQSLYKLAIKNAQKQGPRDDSNIVLEVQSEEMQPSERRKLFKKSNSLNV